MNSPTNPPSNGGPAFPLQSIGPDFVSGYCGMSLRDYFAGQALAGGYIALLTNPSAEAYSILTKNFHVTPETLFAKMAYEVADALLAARERKI